MPTEIYLIKVGMNMTDLHEMRTALSGTEVFTWWGLSSPYYQRMDPDSRAEENQISQQDKRESLRPGRA